MDLRSLAAVYYPPDNHLEALSVDHQGTLTVAWKEQNGPWREPVGLVGPGFAHPGAPLAAVSSAARNQLEVFLVDVQGALNVIWKVENERWRSPVELTPHDFAPQRAGVTAVHYVPFDQLEVFTVDKHGVLHVIWKEANLPWKNPVGLTKRDFAPPGAQVAVVSSPLEDALEVFAVTGNGALGNLHKDHNHNWKPAVELTDPGLAPPGASLAAIYYPPHQQLMVFFVDVRGMLRGMWKEPDGRWGGPFILSLPDLAPPGAGVAAVHYPHYDQAEVFVVDHSGALRVAWRSRAGNWHPPAWLIPEEFAQPGAPIAVAAYPLQDQLELFLTNRADVLHGIAKARNGWWGPCAFPIDRLPASHDQLRPQLLGTVRVGQLTGSRDPQNKPLFNQTLDWGVPGLDLGANTDHRDGKLYIFFGDVVRGKREEGPAQDADLVASISASKLGGHESAGFEFALPFNDTPVVGQRQWRFCVKCHGMYFDGYEDKGVCPGGESHTFHPDSFEFALPHDNTPVQGQSDWRFCVKCHGMYFDGYEDKGVCPRGGGHRTDPTSYRFVLPHDDTPVQGQRAWRFCRRCHGLFFDGYPDKGVCPAGGNAFQLQPVMNGQYFDPFTVAGAIGQTLTVETPTGAFSYDDRAYVFIWVSSPRDSNHPAGAYLVSKKDPQRRGSYKEEFLFSALRFDSKGFWQIAPAVVSNAMHPGLPASDGDGLLIFGHGFNSTLGRDAVHLAWMPLRLRRGAPAGAPSGPIVSETRYLTNDPDPERRWSEDPNDAAALFTRPRYTSLSAVWLKGPRRWLLLYSKAHEREAPTGAVVARIGATPWELSEEIELFNPCVERAFGAYMHWPWRDDIRQRDPQGLSHLEEKPGWAYGAFLLKRFCKWDATRRELSLYYLLSLSSPYQAQVMLSRLHLPN